MDFFENITFDKGDFTINQLSKGEYENCRFNACDFSNSNLSELKFLDCEFLGCNLSLVKLNKTAFRDVKFKECKMLGLQFDTCNEFGLTFNFESCNLTHSSFYQSKIKRTVFKDCNLEEVDFSECDLSSSVLINCNLTNAKFEYTNLENADLRTAFNYSINPDKNRIKKAKFSLNGISGLLDNYDIIIEP